MDPGFVKGFSTPVHEMCHLWQHHHRKPSRRGTTTKTETAPNVEIVAMYRGADGRLIRAAVDQGAKGIVVQALGWGNVNQPMFAAIKEAIGKGIPVVISSRVPTGGVLPNYGFEGGGKTPTEAGAVMADDLSPQKHPKISTIKRCSMRVHQKHVTVCKDMAALPIGKRAATAVTFERPPRLNPINHD